MALAVNTHRRDYAALAFFPSLIFWGLDAYYLWQERRFRDTYDVACHGKSKTYSLTLPALTRSESILGWAKTLLRPTVFSLHLAVVAVIAAIIISLSRR